MIDEPPQTHHPVFTQWRIRAAVGTGLQYELAFQTLDGSHQIVLDEDTFADLLSQAMGLHTMTPEQKAELMKAAEEENDHDDH